MQGVYVDNGETAGITGTARTFLSMPGKAGFRVNDILGGSIDRHLCFVLENSAP